MRFPQSDNGLGVGFNNYVRLRGDVKAFVPDRSCVAVQYYNSLRQNTDVDETEYTLNYTFYNFQVPKYIHSLIVIIKFWGLGYGIIKKNKGLVLGKKNGTVLESTTSKLTTKCYWNH